MSSQADEVIFHHEPPQGEVRYFEGYPMPRMYRQGVHERYGPIILSIQAGYGNYCDPRDTYLPHLAEYTRVEIAMWDLRFPARPDPWDKRDVPFQTMGAWTDPASIGIEGFEDILNVQYDEVAGYVDWDDVNRLRTALADFYGGKDDDPYTIDQHTRNAQGYTSAEYDVFLAAGPDAVELFRQHQGGYDEVVGNFVVDENMPDWMASILDKFREAADGTE